MIAGDLSAQALRQRLMGDGLRLRTGPVLTNIRSPIESVAKGIALHYEAHSIEDDAFADFHISIDRPSGWRRWIRPQVEFWFDGQSPFKPLPGNQGFPMLEWGLNSCISSHCNTYLILHAAVLERHGRALILPAPPGSGKSTLCAGLAFRGWRLLSDELTLISPRSGWVTAVPRPISLKNASIDVLRQFAPAATIGPVVHETVKGTVGHVKPPPEGVRRAHEPALPAWVVLPRYVAGAAPRLEPLSKARTFMQLIDNAFNYHVHGRNGFLTLADLVERCDGYAFSYGKLEEAIPIFDRLAAEAVPFDAGAA